MVVRPMRILTHLGMEATVCIPEHKTRSRVILSRPDHGHGH